MAGRGPAPKDPNKRARRNKDPIELRVIHAEPAAQPDLPADGKWPEQTRAWWRMWGESPLSDEFTDNDWSELLDAALFHAALWRGNMSAGTELRLRVAKFGATPEDRARLRIQFAAADEADEKRRNPAPSSRSRRGPLTDAG